MLFILLSSDTLKLNFKVNLCGNQVPKGTKFKSKNQEITIRFHSNKSKTRPGFKAILRGKMKIVKLNFIDIHI